MRCALPLALALLLLAPDGSAEPADADADPVQQVFSALDRNDLAQAASLLREHRESLPPAARHLLQGYVLLRAGEASAAVRALESATEASPDRASGWLLLGLARYRTEDIEGAEVALTRAEPAGATRPAYWTLHGRLLRLLGRDEAAWSRLNEGRVAVGADPQVVREQIVLLIDLGLLRAAADALIESLPGLDDAVAAAVVLPAVQLLLDRDGAAEAIRVLEAARWASQAVYEADRVWPRTLAVAYARNLEPAVAAALFAELGASFAAADQYRLAGRFSEALRHNARVNDDLQRLPQRFAILVESGQSQRALGLVDGLEERGALTDALRLRAAWSAYEVCELRRAAALLRPLGRAPEARGLRAAVVAATEGDGVCP